MDTEFSSALERGVDAALNKIKRLEAENASLKAEIKKLTAHNTGSPKLPTEDEMWNHVYNTIEFNEEFAREKEARDVVKCCHEFICSQLRECQYWQK